jgi:hypothetical protein
MSYGKFARKRRCSRSHIRARRGLRFPRLHVEGRDGLVRDDTRHVVLDLDDVHHVQFVGFRSAPCEISIAPRYVGPDR